MSYLCSQCHKSCGAVSYWYVTTQTFEYKSTCCRAPVIPHSTLQAEARASLASDNKGPASLAGRLPSGLVDSAKEVSIENG